MDIHGLLYFEHKITSPSSSSFFLEPRAARESRYLFCMEIGEISLFVQKSFIFDTVISKYLLGRLMRGYLKTYKNSKFSINTSGTILGQNPPVIIKKFSFLIFSIVMLKSKVISNTNKYDY